MNCYILVLKYVRESKTVILSLSIVEGISRSASFVVGTMMCMKNIEGEYTTAKEELEKLKKISKIVNPIPNSEII